MITKEQYTEIKNYLLSKKIPLDILIEVNDHFVSQIIDLQNTKNLTFEEAFAETRLIWKPELRMVHNPNFTNDIPILVKRIQNKASKKIIKQSFIIVLAIFIILGISAYISSENTFYYLFTTIAISAIIIPIIQYIIYFKHFRLIKKYANYVITSYQNYSTLSLISAGSCISLFYNIKAYSLSVYKVYHLTTDNYFIIATLPLYLFMLGFNILCFISQRNYLNQVKIVKSHLKHLI